MLRKEAQVLLQHGQVKVAGPPVLTKSIELIVSRCGGDEAKAHAILNTLLKDWYVYCSITNEAISVADLRYWSVDRNEIYRDAEIALKRHEELKSK